MEVKVTEIRRYITLEFKEQDLIELNKELDKIIPKIDEYNKSYKTADSERISTRLINDLYHIISQSKKNILLPVIYEVNKKSD